MHACTHLHSPAEGPASVNTAKNLAKIVRLSSSTGTDQLQPMPESTASAIMTGATALKIAGLSTSPTPEQYDSSHLELRMADIPSAAPSKNKILIQDRRAGLDADWTL